MAFIKTLTLKGYRNHQALTMSFGEGVNLIVSGNAGGKTNILESIYLIGRGESFRVDDPRETIGWEEKSCSIEAEVERPGGRNRVFAYIDNKRRSIRVDGKKMQTANSVGVVLFAPQDITIFRDLPVLRRRYLNRLISGLDRSYRIVLREYGRVLQQRNRILRDGLEGGGPGKINDLDIWSTRLIEAGTSVIIERQRWLKNINGLLPGFYEEMGGIGGGADVSYRIHFCDEGCGREEIREAFKNTLFEKRGLEEIRGLSLVGPHRDDWWASIGGRDVRLYGSQAQMRIMALSLKMAELFITKEAFGETPILLLDDVMSELDEESRERLVNFVKGLDGQVFITSTDTDGISSEFGGSVEIHSLTDKGVTGV